MTEALSDVEKLKIFFLSAHSPELKRMAMIELQDEYDANQTLIKYNNEKYLAFKLLLTSPDNYHYDQIGINRKIDLWNIQYIQNATATQKWGATHTGLLVG